MRSKIVNKIKNGIFNNKLYILSFIIGVIIISILYRFNDTTPFGDHSLLCVDFYHQYGPMMAELYDRLKEGSSFIYSFHMGLGLPFFRNFLNYLSSPFNLIMLLFNRSDLLTSYSFIIGLKAVAACVTMTYYLSKKFNNKELYMIPLGIIYAFSAYFSAYYWNIMWLDGMVFVPLITLGIENIVNKGTWKLYTFSLAIMLLANYFIGYMICIFSVVYFIFYLIYLTRFKKGMFKFMFQRCFTFGIASLIGGMLTFFLLLPMFSSMASISATGDAWPTSQYYAFETIDYLKSHFTGVTTTVFASDEITNPNVSCGILSIALLLAYILNLDISLKNKICYSAILGFFILAFFWAPLDYILHAFHVPNDLPYRYSFLYSFVLVIICAYSLINIRKVKYPLIALGYVFLMSLLLAITQDNWAGITNNMIYINMILLTLYFLFYSAIYYLNSLHTLFYGAIIIVACIDVIVSINYNWDISQVMETFYTDYDKTKELLKYVEDYDDELFYRIENTNMMTLNDPSWYNYNGMTTFSSMAYESMALLQNNLGMSGNLINSYYFAQTTPVYDLMFNIKYFIGEQNDFTRYETIYTDEEKVVEFDYNVGLIYGANKTLKDWNYVTGNPLEMQNDYIQKATGVSDVFKKSTLLNQTELYNDGQYVIMRYDYENPYDNMYFYTEDYSIDFFIIGECLYYVNDSYLTYTSYSDELFYNYLDDYNEEKVVNINSGEDYVTVYVGYNTYYSDAFDMYNIDHNQFYLAYEYLNKYKFDMQSFEEDRITGNITLIEDQTVYTSIPYDSGWKVYVDGELTETYSLGDTLLAFDAKAGTHKIVIKYTIPYLAIGTTISVLTLIGLIINEVYGKRIRHFLYNKYIIKLKSWYDKNIKEKYLDKITATIKNIIAKTGIPKLINKIKTIKKIKQS